MENINKYQIISTTSIRNALKKMDEGGIGIIVCTDSNLDVIGIVTDGDFRRSILEGISLEKSISSVMNRSFRFLKTNYSNDEVSKVFQKTKGKPIPIINENKLVDILIESVYSKNEVTKSSSFNKLTLPVVIMAGGKGTRLDPFTRVLPKPLIPIGNQTIIEIIMEKFAQFGLIDFHISINHKGKMIKAYFEDNALGYNLSFIEEPKPLGTAGSLKYIQSKLRGDILVSNCDIIIDADYQDIYEFHKDNKFDLTIIASMQHHKVPYGVCEIENGGHLQKIIEKPEYDFLVNTGFYVLNSKVLQYIPDDTYFDMTDLIELLKKKNMNVGVYPVSEKSWIDIGQWQEYREALKVLNI